MAEAKSSKGKRKPKRRYAPAEIAGAIAEVVTCGGNITQAASNVGIPWMTLKSWLKKHPNLVNKCEQKKEELAEDQMDRKLSLWSQVEENAIKSALNLTQSRIVDGNTEDIPLLYRDAGQAIQAAAIARDKLQIMAGKPNIISHNQNENTHNLPNIEDQNSVGEFAKRFLAGSNGNGSSGNGNGNGRKLADPVPGINRTSEHAGE